MIKGLAKLVADAFAKGATTPPAEREHALRLATAVLLVEVARADFAADRVEEQAIVRSIAELFGLAADESTLLLAQAEAGADHAASLHEFTRTLHASLSPAEKHRVVEMLWRVALADARLDKHEDHVVRKIAGLLYVSHRDVIRIRNRIDPTHA